MAAEKERERERERESSCLLRGLISLVFPFDIHPPSQPSSPDTLRWPSSAPLASLLLAARQIEPPCLHWDAMICQINWFLPRFLRSASCPRSPPSSCERRSGNSFVGFILESRVILPGVLEQMNISTNACMIFAGKQIDLTATICQINLLVYSFLEYVAFVFTLALCFKTHACISFFNNCSRQSKILSRSFLLSCSICIRCREEKFVASRGVKDKFAQIQLRLICIVRDGDFSVLRSRAHRAPPSLSLSLSLSLTRRSLDAQKPRIILAVEADFH